MIIFLAVVFGIIAVYAFIDACMEDYIRENNPPLYQRWVEFDSSWKSLFISGFHRYENEIEDSESAIEVPVSSDAFPQNSVSHDPADRETPSPAERTARSRVSSADRKRSCYPQLINPNDARPKITTHQIQTMRALSKWEGILRVRFKGRTRRENTGLDLQELAGCQELLLASSTIETSIQQAMAAGLHAANLAYYDDLYKRSKEACALCKTKQKELHPLFILSEDMHRRLSDANDPLWLSQKEDNQTLHEVYNAVHDTIRLLEAHAGVLMQMNLTLCDHIGNDLGREGRAWATQMLHHLRDDGDNGSISDMTA